MRGRRQQQVVLGLTRNNRHAGQLAPSRTGPSSGFLRCRRRTGIVSSGSCDVNAAWGNRPQPRRAASPPPAPRRRPPRHTPGLATHAAARRTECWGGRPGPRFCPAPATEQRHGLHLSPSREESGFTKGACKRFGKGVSICRYPKAGCKQLMALTLTAVFSNSFFLAKTGIVTAKRIKKENVYTSVSI